MLYQNYNEYTTVLGIGIYYAGPAGEFALTSDSTASGGQHYTASNNSSIGDLELRLSLNSTVMGGYKGFL
jgi:hypothetical protein